MEERLKFIFSNVNEWLKFAEAKNGVLIAFNGAAIWGVLQNLPIICDISEMLMLPAYIFLSFAFAGIIVSFFSFMPALTLSKKAQKAIDKAIIKDHSAIFFRDVGKFNADDYLKILHTRSKAEKSDESNSFLLDIANQIIANSRNTWLKYRMFFWALNITLIGMIVPIPFLLVYWIFKWTNK
jgi:hypothetical protein